MKADKLFWTARCAIICYVVFLVFFCLKVGTKPPTKMSCRTLSHPGQALLFIIPQPSEPHLTRYIREQGFNDKEINEMIYPVGTYAYLPWLLLLSLLARLTSVRTAVLCGATGRIGTRLLLLYAANVSAMQLMELFYSAGECCAETARPLHPGDSFGCRHSC
jgi:hypothetical protein